MNDTQRIKRELELLRTDLAICEQVPDEDACNKAVRIARELLNLIERRFVKRETP